MREWKVFALLAVIVVPLGVLVAWTQLQTEPSGSVETVTLEPVEWEFEKPYSSTDWPLWFTSPEEVYATNSYTQESSQITFTVIPCRYNVNFSAYGGSSFLVLSLNLSVSVAGGYVEGVRIVFREDYNASQVRLDGAYGSFEPQWYTWENLTMKSWAYCFYREWTLMGNEKAFIEAVGKDHPSQARFSTVAVHWILKAPENVSQQLEATAEVTYFNGTSHIKAVLPILIRLVADVGDTFETARAITPGNYLAGISRFFDPVDAYKMELLEGQTVRLRVAMRCVDAVNLTLWDPNGGLRASVLSGTYHDKETHFTEELAYVIDTKGHWYIKVSAGHSYGTYMLTVRVEQ